MKNISRRVFIKGMAVAAAATAASTVLAGCNLVPGTNEPVEVPGFQPVTKTLKIDDDNKVDITITSLGVTAAGDIKLGVKVDNDVNLSIKSAAVNTDKAYTLVPVAYYNGNMVVDKATLIDVATTYKDNYYLTSGKTLTASTDAVTYNNEGSFYVKKFDKKDQKATSVSLYFVLSQGVSGSSVNNIAETTFTFSL